MLSLFLPSGAPIILAPLLVVIEAVSYSFRIISLALIFLELVFAGLRFYSSTFYLLKRRAQPTLRKNPCINQPFVA
jgi:hypothetical protein